MQIFPKTTQGLAPFIMVTFIIAVMYFLERYGWYDFSKIFSRGTAS